MAALTFGYAFVVLPSAPTLSTDFRNVSLRVVLRDCLTLAPTQPRPRTRVVDSASYDEPPRTETLSLQLAIVEATSLTFTAGAQLDEVFAGAREIWRSAGIELTLRGPFALARLDAPLSYEPLSAAAASAQARSTRRAQRWRRSSRTSSAIT